MSNPGGSGEDPSRRVPIEFGIEFELGAPYDPTGEAGVVRFLLNGELWFEDGIGPVPALGKPSGCRWRRSVRVRPSEPPQLQYCTSLKSGQLQGKTWSASEHRPGGYDGSAEAERSLSGPTFFDVHGPTFFGVHGQPAPTARFPQGSRARGRGPRRRRWPGLGLLRPLDALAHEEPCRRY